MAKAPLVRIPRSTTRFTLFEKYEGNRQRLLKYDVNALADFEQETGMGFAQLMKQKAVFGTARAMLWAGLKHEDRGLTIEQVGDLIGRFLKDKEIARENRDVQTLLEAAFSAAAEQEAFGDWTTQKEEEDKKEDKVIDTVSVSDPNAPATQDQAQPDSGGANGSS